MPLHDDVLEITKSINKLSKAEGRPWSLLKKKEEIIQTATDAVMYSSYLEAEKSRDAVKGTCS